jgi:hypothetical protein
MSQDVIKYLEVMMITASNTFAVLGKTDSRYIGVQKFTQLRVFHSIE